MRKVVFPILLVLLGVALAPEVAAQSAGKIIDRYKKAVGGKAVKRVKNVFISGSLKSGDTTEGRFTYRAAAPNRLRIDVESTGSKVSRCYNGKSAWRLDERGLRTLLGDEAKLLRLEALIANSRLNDLARNRITARLAGKAQIDGREVDSVVFEKEGVSLKLFFDPSSRLLIKQERETPEGLQETTYSDYRPVDGVMEPFSIKIKNGEREMLIIADKIEHNTSVEEAAFRYPTVEGDRPLPEIEPLMKTIEANQEKIEELKELYTFREAETENKLDGKGQIKESETRVYEVTPVAGDFVRRLVSVDGKPLSASEQEKEDRNVQKEAEKALKRRDKKKEQEDKRDQEEDDSDDRRITVLSFLRLCEITSVRREMFRGHEVIAFDFEPRKGIKPRNRTENLVSKLAGTMWVDEDARQIVRIEARLMDSFKIAGGLFASVAPSTAVAFEQEKIGDEVWLPSYAEVNIFAKVMLFAKINRNVVSRYSDYKKYRIDSQYELAKPDENKKDEEKKPD